jgi:hypothetical protein
MCDEGLGLLCYELLNASFATRASREPRNQRGGQFQSQGPYRVRHVALPAPENDEDSERGVPGGVRSLRPSSASQYGHAVFFTAPLNLLTVEITALTK